MAEISWVINFHQLVISVLVLIFVLSAVSLRTRRWLNKKPGKTVVGFFHPYCNAGGGGERVLWRAIHILLENGSADVVVYSGDSDSNGEQILEKVKQRFDIDIPLEAVQFVFLRSRWLVEASMYPRLTMIGQSLGSIVLGFEALIRCTPDVWFDSMGYAFTFPMAKLVGGCRVVAYVHYPTISTDMLQAVVEDRPTAVDVATALEKRSDAPVSPAARRSRLSKLKYYYYKAFAKLYGVVGSLCDCTMVNSTWTRNHIASLWRVDPLVLYPPCPVEAFRKRSSKRSGSGDRRWHVLSLAQFRPEKDHALQLRAMQLLVHTYGKSNVTLTMIGGCRGEGDEALVTGLKRLRKELNLEGNVQFEVNAPYSAVLERLTTADMGLHTMWNEHFGIGVVEMMAAGVVTIAHCSGGPKEDIILHASAGGPEQTGFLAASADEYAKAMEAVMSGKIDLEEVRGNAMASIERFSEEEFERKFKGIIESAVI